MAKFTLKNIFETDKDTFWAKVFFDEEYNRRLYLEALGFKGYELLELKELPGGVRTRRIRTEPKSEAPAVVTKLIGGDISYTEEGRWDPSTGIWKYTITTSKLSDKISIAGTFWVEPRGDKRIERICENDIQVKIFGVGGTVEGFIEKTTRDSYAKTEAFTNAFIREKGL
ncbi:DUF2505 domain-containing protein [Sandaracinus amylolyticus]|uniref:DUF2505 domain-containing protein n=1 Tax=Sandaracinus amylolyticus TaxID=927083 RepID=A0A0F6SE45_9BACT|nr:DUF2505 domain-containing protein [Sandaracinus amylolyticus]AKF04554.1 hypothetical protein DB32_001703 [Sandaracinus amylolyticus]